MLSVWTGASHRHVWGVRGGRGEEGLLVGFTKKGAGDGVMMEITVYIILNSTPISDSLRVVVCDGFIWDEPRLIAPTFVYYLAYSP